MLPSLAPKQQSKGASLSNRLLKHQHQLLNFLFHSEYDIIYLTFQQKHAAYLQRKENKDIRSLRLQQMKRHYQAMSEKLHIRILRFDIELDKEVYRLEALWDALQIPYFHRYYFQSFVYTAFYKNIPSVIANEQKMCRSETHIYFAINRALMARQACLRNLKIKLSELTPEDVYEYLHITKQKAYFLERKFEKQKYEIQGYKVKHLSDNDKQPTVWKTKLQLFFQCFGHLKKLTFYVVDLIAKWRQYVQSLTHDLRKQKEHLSYYYMEDNYILKVLTDLGFLRVSVLANFFDFAMRNDPFLLKCILTFEGKQNKTIDDQLLKHLIFPDEQEYYEIMAKLDIMAKEYHSNIQKRRVYDLSRNPNNRKSIDRFDPNVNPARQGVDRANQYLREFQQKEKARSLARLNTKPLSPMRTIAAMGNNSSSPKKLKNPFELKQPSRMSKSFRIIEFKDKKKIQVLAASSIREGILENADRVPTDISRTPNPQSPTKSTLIKRQSTPTPKPRPFQSPAPQMVNSQTLSKLKEQVVRRVKQQFKSNAMGIKPIVQRDDALKNIIEQQLLTATKSLFPFQPKKKQPTKQMQLLTRSFKQQNVKYQLSKIFKGYPQPYIQLFMPVQQLQKVLQLSLYCIVIQAVIANQTVGYVFCGLDTDSTQFKILRVYHIMSYNIGYLQQLILRSVQFLWKYQNSFEVVFTLLTPTANKQLVSFTQDLNSKLQNHALVIVKQNYTHQAQNKYIFKRKLKNTKYIPNRYPGKLYLDLKMIMSLEQLIDSTGHKSQFEIDDTVYELLLAQMMRRYASSQDIILLKQRSPWRGKLKYVLDLLIKIEGGDLKVPEIQVTQTDKISQVNKKLKQNKQKLIELGDSKKQNRVALLQTRFTMEFDNRMQYGLIDSTPSYRITINGKIAMIRTKTVTGYILRASNRAESLLFLPAEQYLASIEKHSSSLLIYLSKELDQAYSQVVEASNLWVHMHRVPTEFCQRDEVYVKTNRLSELALLKKQLYYSQQLQFFTDLSLQNGIQLTPQPHDLVIKKPYIMAIFTNSSPLYAKCIRQ